MVNVPDMLAPRLTFTIVMIESLVDVEKPVRLLLRAAIV